MANAPDEFAKGTLQIHVSSAVNIAAARAFVKVGLGEQTQSSQTVEVTAGEHRFSADFLFCGVYSQLTAAPMLVSGWEAHAEGSIGLLGEARIDAGALVAEMLGVQCGVPVATGQVRGQAPYRNQRTPRLPVRTAVYICWPSTSTPRLLTGSDLVHAASPVAGAPSCPMAA